MKFHINYEYVKMVNHNHHWNMYKNKENPTEEDLVAILEGKGDCSSYSTSDHEKFLELRNHLEQLGLIKTERHWSNGDRVLKSFNLNGVNFSEGHKFFCAGAMRYTLDPSRQGGIKDVDSYY